MLNASSSNHAIFSFGRSNGTNATESTNAMPPPVIHAGDDDDDNNEIYLASEDSSADRTAGLDFLPSVSFDDLQSSLESASTGFKLAQFPSPSGRGNILSPEGIVDKMVEQASAVSCNVTDDDIPMASPAAVAAAAAVASASANANSRISLPQSATTPSVGSSARIAKSGSILRRPSISTRQSFTNSTSSTTTLDSTSAPASSRQRRQSHYPPVSNTHGNAKPPRKSAGPGAFEPEYNSGVSGIASRRRPSLASNSDRAVTEAARLAMEDGGRLGSSGNDTSKNPNSSRAAKARSFHQNTTSSRASLPADASSIKAGAAGLSRTPKTVSHSNSTGNFSPSASSNNGNAKPSLSRNPTVSRRMSLAPVLHASHATGLGARTVSPTDARRLKRMSVMPPTPNGAGSSSKTSSRDITQAVPLPPPSDARASSRSPSMLPRKASPPSSSTTTPDPNHKSYGSGVSSGSSISFSTARTSTGSMQPRLPQGAASSSSGMATTSSRLPAPKALTMLGPASNADDDEYVPPVPAIPKGYESPKGSPAELSFLEKRKSNLALDSSSIHSSSTTSLSGSHPGWLDLPTQTPRKSSLHAEADYEKTNNTTTGVPLTHNSKKSLQPLRLPPMNVQPLSKPTAAKIAARQDRVTATPDRNLSPPPSRNIAKTPTTPMTASKGSFFSSLRNEDTSQHSLAMRSQSSVYLHTRTDSGNDADDTSSSEMFSASAMSTKSSFQKPSTSPYLSVEPSYLKTPRTPVDDGDKGYTTPLFTTPAQPPTSVPPVSTARKPSGPRAPAPTPSRAFASIESASTIIGYGETLFLMDPMPPLKAPTEPPKSPPPVSSPEEPATPSSIGSSLRRKLSLSWKKNNSKSSISTPGGPVPEKPSEPPASESKKRTDNKYQTHSRHASSTDKYDGMPPPPRIPKSATLSNISSMKKSPTPTTISTTPSKVTASYLESRRRKSSASSLNSIITNEKVTTTNWTPSERHQRKEALPASTVSASKAPTHAPSTVQKTPNSKPPAATMRHHHPHHPHHPHHDVWSTELDADDMHAEEEVRKLGSRRKETAIAARTLDALRKRATPKERVSAQEAARIAMLNIYERGEIVDYEDVYFCGTQNAAKVVGSVTPDKLPNFGYDDERGDYTIVAGDHLAYRYEIIDLLGKGSFGQVVRCIDHKTGVLVAVKIIRNKKRFHQQALVEVNILQKLREWDPKNKHSMVNFTHSFYFRGHLCISTELLDANLYEFIKANAFRGFSLKLIRRFTKQMLSSLMLLKQHKVIHCDLKPENVLLRHPLHSEIKVIDFGSSCFENERVYTYIQSRFYRSPEVILGMTYGMPIDMWSLGCILAELYTGVPIFPGENEQEQLACIMEVFGPPEKHLIEKSTRKKLFFDSMGKPRLTVSSKGRRRRPSSKTLQQVIKCDDEAFLDFLARCLRWDPDRRLKPEEAIRHHFITGQKAPPPPLMSRGMREGSPVRRQNPAMAGTGMPRPLPDPPARDAGKLGAVPVLRGDGSRESLGASSGKSTNGTGGPYRRQSAVTSATASSLARRTTIATTGTGASQSGNGSSAPASGLPRAAGRVASGGNLGGNMSKPEMATAGAAAAMTRRG